MNYDFWYQNPEWWAAIGSIGVVFTVLIIEFIFPWTQKRKNAAKEKIENFYDVAYAFVEIRENFSISISNETHNKENCGYFHNFNFEDGAERRTGLVFNEFIFFDYVSSNFRFIDEDLKFLFINYFKVRGPEGVQNRLGCKNSKLINLRKEIENKINFYYFKYKEEAS